MPSATVQGPYASINTIFHPPEFSLDTTFKGPPYLILQKNVLPPLEAKLLLSYVALVVLIELFHFALAF